MSNADTVSRRLSKKTALLRWYTLLKLLYIMQGMPAILLAIFPTPFILLIVALAPPGKHGEHLPGRGAAPPSETSHLRQRQNEQ